MYCDGWNGHCDETCHRSCLGLNLRRIQGDRREWFCPTCIRKNRCVNKDGERLLNGRTLTTAFKLPPIQEIPTETLALNPEVLSLFLDLYRHLDANSDVVKNKRRTTRRNRRSSVTAPVSTTARGRRLLSRQPSRRTPEVNTETTRTYMPQSRARPRVERRPSASSARSSSTAVFEDQVIVESLDSDNPYHHTGDEPALPCVDPPRTGHQRQRHTRERTLSEIAQAEEARIMQDLGIDDIEEPAPPPMRGVPSDFAQYEAYERQVLGHLSYGTSRFASSREDGGVASGRQFLADLLGCSGEYDGNNDSSTTHPNDIVQLSTPSYGRRPLPNQLAQLQPHGLSVALEPLENSNAQSCCSLIGRGENKRLKSSSLTNRSKEMDLHNRERKRRLVRLDPTSVSGESRRNGASHVGATVVDKKNALESVDVFCPLNFLMETPDTHHQDDYIQASLRPGELQSNLSKHDAGNFDQISPSLYSNILVTASPCMPSNQMSKSSSNTLPSLPSSIRNAASGSGDSLSDNISPRNLLHNPTIPTSSSHIPSRQFPSFNSTVMPSSSNVPSSNQWDGPSVNPSSQPPHRHRILPSPLLVSICTTGNNGMNTFDLHLIVSVMSVDSLMPL